MVTLPPPLHEAVHPPAVEGDLFPFECLGERLTDEGVHLFGPEVPEGAPEETLFAQSTSSKVPVC